MQKIIIASTIIGCLFGSATAQTRYFCYDAAGNRMLRNTTSCISLTVPNQPVVMRDKNDGNMLYEAAVAPSLAAPVSQSPMLSFDAAHAPTNSATLYPNPTTGISQLTFDGVYSFSYKLYDVSGRLLRQGSIEGVQTHTFDITSQVSGLYVLQIHVKETGKSYTWQVMKD